MIKTLYAVFSARAFEWLAPALRAGPPRWLPATVLTAVAFALYGPFLGSPAVFDDFYLFQGAMLDEYARSPFRLTLRWLPYASLGWTAMLAGENIVWMRLGNVVLHALTAIALYALLARLFLVMGELRDADAQRRWCALAGALIFVAHPVAVYGVAYLVQRAIVMATLFSLLSWLALWEGLARARRDWLLLSALCYFLAVFSKEHAVAAPAVALLLIYPGDTAARLRFALPAVVLYGITAVLVTLVSRGVLGSAYEPSALDMLSRLAADHEPLVLEYAYPLSALTQTLLFFKYLLLWALPHPAWMSVDMRQDFATGFSELRYVAGALAFAAWGVAGWVLLRRSWLLAAVAMLAPWALFAVEFSAVRIQEPFVLYRSYLWMPLAFAVLPMILARLPPFVTFALPVAVVTALFPVSIDRLRSFGDPLALWQDAEKLLRARPQAIGAERIHNNMAFALKEKGRLAEALQVYERAIELNPAKALTYNDRGVVYMELGRIEEALGDFNKALDLIAHGPPLRSNRSPEVEALAHYNIGIVHFRRREPEPALERYNRSLQLNPRYSQAYNNRGVLLFSQGRYREALPDFERAVALERRNVQARYGLGLVQQKLGRAEAASTNIGEACRRGFAPACAELGQPRIGVP